MTNPPFLALRRGGSYAPGPKSLKGFRVTTGYHGMNAYFTSVLALGRRPSAFVPISMSMVALVMVLATVAVSGVEHGQDEGAVAHLWQSLMAGQLPLLAFFLIKWLPRAPQAALSLLALQICAALAALAPVYILGL
jgi:hypothetical protein